ncbi:site-2 protease family protein [Paenibacillus thermotolerans]|uniref:site-2 protease family protein n=1 Tax=Paenibacillus thermotolerans TaxID=3027807 RepID=UPI00236802D5|nr:MULTISPECIES: site-2 protease family protein [unclassified Paenibacillus]
MSKLLGVRLKLHPLLTIVLILSAFTGHFIELITLFGIVFIHELGHVAAAKHFGWRFREIQLTPFGGVAVVDDAGSIPAREEAIVAACGPAMNLIMIGFAYAMQLSGLWTEAWVSYWIHANGLLMLFNLLPVLPLDGGKLLQAGLSLLLPYHFTMKLGAAASLVLSALMLGIAFSRVGKYTLELNLAMIGAFLLYSNWHEWRSLHYRFLRFLMSRSLRVPEWVRQGAAAKPIMAGVKTQLPDVVTKFMRERLHIVLVLDKQGKLLGAIPEEKCTAHYLEKKKDSAVIELFM